MHVDQALAVLHQEWWVLASNVPSRQLTAVDRRILTTKAELLDHTTPRAANSAQCHLDLTVEALNALPISQPQVASDGATLPVRSAAEGTVRRAQAA